MNGTGDLLVSRQDLEFILYEWLDIEQLTSSGRYSEHSKDVFDSVLDLYEQIATEQFQPLNRMLDAEEPTFDGADVLVPDGVSEALTRFTDTGLVAASLDQALGGGQLPTTVSRAGYMYLQAANVALSAYPILSAANAALICRYGTEEQIDAFARPMVEGRFFGTMCLSEPDVGSSLGDVSTRAVPAEDGNFRLFGNKMWISGGEHALSENIIHLVLARVVGAPSGVKGLSLFIVPKVLVGADGTLGERNDVVLAGLNHKMGSRGTVNTLLNFGEGAFTPGGEAGAVGRLVGEEGMGLHYMFHMMNEARLAVGAGAVALGYTGYLHALSYARERTQGRPFEAKSTVSPVPIVRHPDVRRMLLASKSYVEGGLALVLFSAMVMDRAAVTEDPVEAEDLNRLLDVLTPVVKAWPSAWCLKANDLAIQIHGGYGYTREYPVEQFYRDNRLNAIHEGTDGIQSLDLVGRKLKSDGGAGLRVLEAHIRATLDALPASLEWMGRSLRRALERVVEVTSGLWTSGDDDVSIANSYSHATAVGHLVVAWMWAEQVNACEDRWGDVYDGKRLAARYFFDHELPTIYPTLDLLEGRDRLFLTLEESHL